MRDMARIEDVVATGSDALAFTWTDDVDSNVDLAGWIARGGQRFVALGNALVFSGAKPDLCGAT